MVLRGCGVEAEVNPSLVLRTRVKVEAEGWA
jgi:hypothetical protein